MIEHSLPLGWAKITIEDIVTFINPGFPSGKHNSEGRGTPHLRPMNITYNGKISLEDTKYVETSKYEPLQKGDVLFNNTNSSNLVGKTSYIREDSNWAYSNHMTRLRFNQEYVEPLFISYYLHHLFYNGYFKSNCNNHVSQASIGTKFLLQKVPIAFPPLAEQKRIVAKLDVLIEKVDSSKERLEKIPDILKRFRQSVLAAAVTGRLTADWREKNPNVESAEVLLENIKNDRLKKYFEECSLVAQQKNRKPAKPRVDTIETAGKLPVGWRSAVIEQLFFVETGATPLRAKIEYWNNGDIPWIKSGLVQNRDIWEADEFITKKALSETNVKIFPIDTLLIAMYGEGKTRGQIGRLKIQATTNQAIAALVNSDLNSIVKDFIYYFALSQYDLIRLEAAGGNQPNLNLDKIKNWKIDLPPLSEQEEIICRLKELFSLASQIEAKYEAVKDYIDQLPQAILSKAFRGELVPQDLNDEPASILLERIQQEKLGKGKTTKPVIQQELFAE